MKHKLSLFFPNQPSFLHSCVIVMVTNFEISNSSFVSWFISFRLPPSAITTSIMFYFGISQYGLTTSKSQGLKTERFISPPLFFSIEGGWGPCCPCPGSWVDGRATIVNVVGPCEGRSVRTIPQALNFHPALLLVFHWLKQVSWPYLSSKGGWGGEYSPICMPGRRDELFGEQHSWLLQPVILSPLSSALILIPVEVEDRVPLSGLRCYSYSILEASILNP